MAVRLAYFKHLKLGDALVGPEDREPPIDETEFLKAGWGMTRTAIQRGGGNTYRFTAKSHLLLGDAGAENTRQFEGRKLQLLKDIRTAAGFVAGTFANRGTFSVIESSTDVTTTVNSETAGSAVIIEITADPGFVAGDYALLVSGTSYEVIRCGVVNPGVSVRADTLVNNWTAGATIARLAYHVNNAYMQRAPRIPGNEPGTARASLNLEWVFESAEDPVWYLP